MAVHTPIIGTPATQAAMARLVLSLISSTTAYICRCVLMNALPTTVAPKNVENGICPVNKSHHHSGRTCNGVFGENSHTYIVCKEGDPIIQHQ